MTGAALTALELALSGTVPLGTVLPAMLGTHLLIAAGEAVITVAAVSAVLEHPSRPPPPPGVRMKRFTILALAVALILGVVVSPFASSKPDGLERVATDQGFVDAADVVPAPTGRTRA